MTQDNTVTVQGSGIWQQASTVTTSRLTLWGIINVGRNCGIPCSPGIQEAEMEKGRACREPGVSFSSCLVHCSVTKVNRWWFFKLHRVAGRKMKENKKNGSFVFSWSYCLCVCEHAYPCGPLVYVRGQKTTCKSRFSSPIMHALEIYLRLWGLVTSPFTCWVNPQVF